MASLVVCPSCSRHVRVDESSCPFCVQSIPGGLVAPPRGPRRQYVGKGATALALASALVAAGCGEDGGATAKTIDDAATTETQSDSGADVVTDADADARADSDAADDGGSFPVYK